MLRFDWLVFHSCDWCVSILAVGEIFPGRSAVIGSFRSSLLVRCFLGGQLSYGSPVVVFLDCGHLRFRNLCSTVPVDVVRVKSYVNCLFDPAGVRMRITINKLNLIPKQSETHQSQLWKPTDHSEASCFIRTPETSRPHRLTKTSSMQSKRRDSYHT